MFNGSSNPFDEDCRKVPRASLRPMDQHEPKLSHFKGRALYFWVECTAAKDLLEAQVLSCQRIRAGN